VTGLTCDKGDSLKLTMTARARSDNKETVQCNLCNQPANVVSGYYACCNAESDCNYNTCLACYKGSKTFEEGKTCATGDILVLRTHARAGQDINSIQCTICKSSSPVLGGFYVCGLADRDCDYNVCPACFRGQKTVALGMTCDSGDLLLLKTAARVREPFSGTDKFDCNLCG